MSSSQQLLQINSSGRIKDSITREVSNGIIQILRSNELINTVISRDLATGLPFVDEQWIEANFTADEERTTHHRQTLEFSDSLVNELQHSDYVLIASPIYNFSIPAVLKAWIDMISRAGLTFQYTENGPKGLLNNKRAILVIASGGVPIGSEMDFASKYLKQVLGFIGIQDVTIVDANHFDKDLLIENITQTKSAITL